MDGSEIFVGEFQEGRPVEQVGVAADMKPKSDVAANHIGIRGGQGGGAQVLHSEQAVHRSRDDTCHKFTDGIRPKILRAAGYENGPRRDEGEAL